MYPMRFGPRSPRMSPPPVGPRFGNPSSNPFMRIPPQMGQRSGGGLLSKLFGGRMNRNPAQLSGGFRAFGSSTAQGSGSIFKSLSNPASINSFLSNTQKVLNTAQQVGPLVQQYGPIVKNLPSMWKLYRGLKDAPEFKKENTNSDETDNTNSVNKNNKTVKNNNNKKESSIKEDYNTPSTKRSPQSSKPKLYV